MFNYLLHRESYKCKSDILNKVSAASHNFINFIKLIKVVNCTNMKSIVFMISLTMISYVCDTKKNI